MTDDMIRFSKADVADMLELARALRGQRDPEEIDAIAGAFEEILKQEPITATKAIDRETGHDKLDDLFKQT